MTSPAVVGKARIEIESDLGAFATVTEGRIKEAFRAMGPETDRAMQSLGESMGRKLDDGMGDGVKANTGKITGATREATTKAGEEGSSTFGKYGHKAGEKFRDSLKESLKSGASIVLGGSAILGAGELIKKGVEAADELEGANIKIEGAFGESSKSVQTWAKSLASSLGLSQGEAEQTAGTFGQMLHAMGVGQDEAAGMSEKMVELAQNVARFNNADPAAVQQAFVAAMRGRGKAMLQFGINMDSTTIAAEALRHGIVKMAVDQNKVAAAQDALNTATEAQTKIDKNAASTAADRAAAAHKVAAAHDALKAAMGGALPVLTQSQKGEAAYYAILDGTKNQQHAVADSTHTLAQQKKILSAEVTNVEARLGTALFPTLVKVSELITRDVVPAFGAVSHWVKDNETWLKPLVATLGIALITYKLTTTAVTAYQKVASVLGGTMRLLGLGQAASTASTEAATLAQGELAAATEASTVAAGEATIATAELDTAMDANPIGLIVAALAALVAGLVIAYKHSKTFRDIVDDMGKAVMWVWHNVLEPVVDFFKKHWKLAIEIALGPLGLIIGNFHKIEDVVNAVFDTFKKLPGKLGGLIKSFADVGLHLMQSIWNGIKGGVSAGVGAVHDAIATVWNAISDFINSNLIDPIKDLRIKIGVPGYHHTFQPFGGIPELPRMARGGMTRGETALVAGDNPGGKELIMPMDSTESVNTLAASMRKADLLNAPHPDGALPTGGVPERLAGMIDGLVGAIADLADRPVIVEVDRREIARAANEGNLRLARR